jgi:hypothetical protein
MIKKKAIEHISLIANQHKFSASELRAIKLRSQSVVKQ